MKADIWYTEKNPQDNIGITLKINDVLFRDSSEFQEVEVVETDAYGRMLLLDGLVMTTEKDEFFYHEQITHIPMLTHKNPENILVIGGGDGGTVREVLRHPSVKNVVLCEIDGMVIEASKKFLPTIAGQLDDPRVDIQVRDGIEYIAQKKNEFDVILIDSTDPIGPGEGLFTEEFYGNVRDALKEDGIMVNQTESPIANKREMGLIYMLLRKVFPIVKPYVGPVPTYPGAFWSWGFCSKTVQPLEYINEEVAKEIEKGSKYYNRNIHRSAFSLPNFIKEIVGEE